MKSLGIVRKMDELGRVVVPMEVRRANGWETGQPLEMLEDNNGGLYIKAFGRDEEKKGILEQLEHVKSSTTNDSVYLIIGKTIEFLNKQG